MAGSLQSEIKQTKPFLSRETEALLALARTADRVADAAARELKPWDLTPAQYNVLRILRGAEPDGLHCGGIAERMVTRDPDITRLLDRLEKRGLIRRERQATDRRVVTSRITAEGLDILAKLDQPIEDLNHRLLGRLGTERLEMLIELLEAARRNL